MYGSGRFLCVLGFVGAAACSAGADVGESPRDSTLHQSSLDGAPIPRVSLGSPLTGGDANDAPPSDSEHPNDDAATPEPAQPCTCGNPIPGITIEEQDGELIVGVTLPGAAAIAIHVNGNDCEQSEQGLSLSGDVSVDLGGAVEIPLLAVELDILASGAAELAIHGTAMVGSDLLGDIIAPSEPAAVRADIAIGINSDHEAQLDLTLDPAALTLDTGDLPLASAAIALHAPSIVLSASSQGEQLEVRGSLDANANLPWLGAVPLALAGDLEVTAWILDRSWSSLALKGDLQLDGNSLVCGLTRLKSVTLPSATLTWDEAGLQVEATAVSAVHPALSVLGNLDITASFAPNDWRIKACGDAVLEVGADALEAFDCLELSKEGVKVCEG